ncbi:MAG: hypothetical protein EXQ83_14475 [Xanthobacteraceae bacterium]|nr:hypothetical protein [Xanthobacteraceae bacterium]
MWRLLWATCAISAAGVSCALAAEPFIGRWAVKPEACRGQDDTAQTAALVATDTLLWWFDGYCRIGKMYKAKAVYVQVHCGAKDVPVTLDAQGDCMRVNWGTAKAEELKRCN